MNDARLRVDSLVIPLYRSRWVRFLKLPNEKWSETSKFDIRPCYRTSPHRVKERKGMQNFETGLVMETRLHCPAKQSGKRSYWFFPDPGRIAEVFSHLSSKHRGILSSFKTTFSI